MLTKLFTCGSLHQWNPPRCFCGLWVGLSSLASCRHRYPQSHSRSLRSGSSAWSRRHCHCHWPEPECEERNTLWPDSTKLLEDRIKSFKEEQYLIPSSYPLVRAPAPGQHEDVIHLSLLLLFLNFASLLFRDDIVPFSPRLLQQLWSGLFHAGEIGNLQRRQRNTLEVEREEHWDRPDIEMISD